MRLRRYQYSAYIQSEAWQQVRARFFKSKLWKGCCFGCGRNVPVDLHHRTYRRLGCERLSDLIPLCRECHKLTHEIFEASDDKSKGLYRVHKKLKSLAKA